MLVTCGCIGTYLCWAWLAFPPIVFNHDKQVYHTQRSLEKLAMYCPPKKYHTQPKGAKQISCPRKLLITLVPL